ncbi:Adenylosuccinate lyase @ SAICAR lyase [hydrothermal vent metagenome]|uniref:Adenylosuccinate lyase @ SAICAR lyase n=1 Tax=hydrothermal vent metagenome TaxID=652676 RepID=A0A3B0UV51_9ZZZZ
MTFTHDSFISPFSWRYGSDEMRQIWSERHKRRLMRRVWVALATAQQQAGLVTEAQVADLQAHADRIDIDRALEIEKETRHDVMAEIRTFAEQCKVGGGIIHWGATSADITDNVDVLRLREAAVLLQDQLKIVLTHLAERIEETAALPTMAHTHIQPAEPTTLGYRFAVYAQDLLEDYKSLQSLTANLRGKGLKGAVGTQAAYAELLRDAPMDAEKMEAVAMAQLELPYFSIATQTYTRQQDLRVQQVLAGIAASLHKFALDFRVLQSPPFGEWAEPFGKKQVGSSAMPFKRNPINAENICSLARYVAGLPAVAWDNASQAILERSLDDSANRRIFQAEGFLATDELLRRATRLVAGMVIDEQAIARNMATYGPFAATERVLMALVAAGASRQAGHEWIREASLQAWATLREGEANPLLDLLLADGRIGRFLAPEQIKELMGGGGYVGTAVIRARAFAQTVRTSLGGE